jgi:hypothetical protein
MFDEDLETFCSELGLFVAAATKLAFALSCIRRELHYAIEATRWILQLLY